MKRAILILFVLVVVVACATTQQRSADPLVSRAVQAVGGADALNNVKTVSVKGTLRQWEPEQSIVAGGEMRLACDSTFEQVTDRGVGATRIDWVRNFHYPTPRTFTFTEIVTPDAGYVAGIDSNGRTRQSLESNPPAHAMSGLRLATTQRELGRTPNRILRDMLQNPDRASGAGNITVAGAAYPALNYRSGDQSYIVLFDPKTGLPARIRTLDYDNVWGDVNYDLVLADWQMVDGLRVPMSRTYELNGRPVAEIKITEVRRNMPVAADRLTIPPAFKASAAKPANGPAVPYQWVIRRQFIGTYLDSDNPSYDTRAAGAGLKLVELGPGIQHVAGGTHNALIVEMSDHLIVFDAPVSDAQSNWTLNAARQQFGNKPVKYVVLTHHHMDHAGGLRAYAAQGATVVVGKGNGEHFRRALAAPFTRNPDVKSRDLSGTRIIEVADKQVLTDGRRQVDVYLIENPHAAGLVIGYVPDARLGFVTDLWSPGRDPLPGKITPPLAAVVAGVKKAGIAPLKFAGGHGSTGDYPPLAELAGR